MTDREANATWLFKSLESRERPWDFIIPLCKTVVGPKPAFKDITPWVAGAGDEVCGGRLLLQDSKAAGEPLEVRVVGRRRHRKGKVSWYATLVDVESIPDAEVLRLHFRRWPHQEHAFRNAGGRLHLDTQQGHAKRPVDNVAVLDRLEKLDARARKAASQLDGLEIERATAIEALDQRRTAVSQVELRVAELQLFMERALAGNYANSEAFRTAWATTRTLNAWLPDRRVRVEAAASTASVLWHRCDECRRRITALNDDRSLLERRRTIHTVDVELDEIMAAF